MYIPLKNSITVVLSRSRSQQHSSPSASKEGSISMLSNMDVSLSLVELLGPLSHISLLNNPIGANRTVRKQISFPLKNLKNVLHVGRGDQLRLKFCQSSSPRHNKRCPLNNTRPPPPPNKAATFPWRCASTCFFAPHPCSPSNARPLHSYICGDCGVRSWGKTTGLYRMQVFTLSVRGPTGLRCCRMS